MKKWTRFLLEYNFLKKCIFALAIIIIFEKLGVKTIEIVKYLNYMRIFKSIFVLLFIMMTFSSYSQNEKSYSFVDSLNTFASDSCNNKVYYNRIFIPRIFKKKLREHFHTCFRIANPNRLYRKTDVIRIPFLPNKQMLFLIKNKNKYVLVYHQGGRGHHTKFVFVEIVSSKIVYFKECFVHANIITVSDFLEKVITQQNYLIQE